MADQKTTALEQTRRLLEAQNTDSVEHERVWRGLAVSAGNLNIVVPITNVVELAVCENITPVPLTKSWVRGLTNLRGQLVTVADLSVFVGAGETRLSRDARIIVLADSGLNSCLLVNNVAGLKVFSEDQPQGPVHDVSAELIEFFSGSIEVDNDSWLVMDVPALVANGKFRSPARVASLVR